MAYHDNKSTNMNTSLPSSGKGGSTTSKINIKSIAKKFEKKVSKFIDKIPNNSNKTVNLYNTFGKAEDNIEFNVYDVTDSLISHTRDFKNYIFTEEGKQTTECRMGNVADGISERLAYDYTIEPGDLPRTVKKEEKRADKLKALGNSIIPQCVAVFFQSIKDCYCEYDR